LLNLLWGVAEGTEGKMGLYVIKEWVGGEEKSHAPPSVTLSGSTAVLFEKRRHQVKIGAILQPGRGYHLGCTISSNKNNGKEYSP